MLMLMMRIRIMRMCVDQRLMPMRMRVARAGWQRATVMPMVMVLITGAVRVHMVMRRCHVLMAV